MSAARSNHCQETSDLTDVGVWRARSSLKSRLLLVLGILVVSSYVWAGPATAATKTPRLPLVDWNCYSPGKVEPTQILLACGDGNAVMKHLTWTTWTTTSATGQGVLESNDCHPSCVGGTFHTYPARFTLTETVRASGRNYFTRVTMQFTAKRPSGRKSVSVSDCFATPPKPFIPRCPADLLADR
jgi:hypothetical protein